MKSLRRCSALAAVVLLSGAATARADVTLTFAPLAGSPNGSSFTSETEQGFTVSKTSGSFFVGTVFGNPVPSIFVGPVPSPVTSSITITPTGGGTFDFESLDVSSNNGTSGLGITGSLGGNTVFTENTTAPATGNPTFNFTTISSTNTGLISSLTIVVTPGLDTNSINLDNIHLSTTVVPEPSTIAMAGVGGLMLLGYAWRLRRGRTAVPVA
jgi:PEP-CTERM motif